MDGRGPDRLSSAAAKAIVDPDNDVFLGAIGVGEIAIKRALGRLDFPLEALDETLAETGFEPLDFTARPPATPSRRELCRGITMIPSIARRSRKR